MAKERIPVSQKEVQYLAERFALGSADRNRAKMDVSLFCQAHSELRCNSKYTTTYWLGTTATTETITTVCIVRHEKGNPKVLLRNNSIQDCFKRYIMGK